VGCYQWEKDLPRDLIVELTLRVDCQQAGLRDDLKQGFNYEPLGKRLLEFCEGGPFGLVEAVSEGVARICVEEFDQDWVRVSVTKRESLPAMDGVTVTIERTREDFSVSENLEA
jgi:dihydroneopterin aldolase